MQQSSEQGISSCLFFFVFYEEHGKLEKNISLERKMTLSNVLNNFLTENLDALKNQGLYNEIDPVEGANGAKIQVRGSELINLSSNNYLGLATNPELKQIAKDAVDKYGVGAGAVRTINGTLDLHVKLEEKLAEFKGTEAAISYQSGFNCNMAAISAVMDKNDAIFQTN